MKAGTRSLLKTNIATIPDSTSTLRKSTTTSLRRKSVAVSVVRTTMRMRMAVSSTRMRLTLRRIRMRVAVCVLPSQTETWQSMQAGSSLIFGLISSSKSATMRTRKTMNNGRLAFFNLVKQMRQAQKDFYSTKGQDWQSVRKPLWDKSLALEKRVDEYIAHGDAYLQQHQPSLFDK